MEEQAYRQKIDEVFATVDRAFDDADPDLAECALSQGTCTILFHEKLRFIISPQTPVRQIWVAFRDRAWHMDLDPQSGKWMDDRNEGIELFSLIAKTTKDEAGVEVCFG